MTEQLDEVGKAKRFWLGGRQVYGRIVAVDEDGCLVEHAGRFFEVAGETSTSEKGFDQKNLPARWVKPEPPHPGEQALPLGGTGSAPAEKVDAGDVPAGVTEHNQDRDLAATITREEVEPREDSARANDGSTSSADDDPANVSPDKGIKSDIGPSGTTENITAPSPAVSGEGDKAPLSVEEEQERGGEPGKDGGGEEVKRRGRKPRQPAATGGDASKPADPVASVDTPFQFDCPYCGEHHERQVRPAEEKGMWEMVSGRKIDIVTNPTFVPCANCKEPIAVKIIPVTVYTAKVAGF